MFRHESEGNCDAEKEISKAVSKVTKVWEIKKGELIDEVKEELQTGLQITGEGKDVGRGKKVIIYKLK